MTGLVVQGGPLSETHVAFKTDVFPPVVVVVETAVYATCRCFCRGYRLQ